MEALITSLVAPAIRHGLTTAGGFLVAKGLLDVAQQGNFVSIGLGIASGLIGFGLSLAKNRKK